MQNKPESSVPEEFICKQLAHAFMGVSIYKDVLLPVYDLGACLETFANQGLSEDEAVELINSDEWIKQFGMVKPVFWVGNPDIQQKTVH